MNVYRVIGIVEYDEIGECESCGQETEKERERHIALEVEAENEKSAITLALAKATDTFRSENKLVEIANVRWKKNKNPKAEFVREISEAEKLKRLGMPTLF